MEKYRILDLKPLEGIMNYDRVQYWTDKHGAETAKKLENNFQENLFSLNPQELIEEVNKVVDKGLMCLKSIRKKYPSLLPESKFHPMLARITRFKDNVKRRVDKDIYENGLLRFGKYHFFSSVRSLMK